MKRLVYFLRDWPFTNYLLRNFIRHQLNVAATFQRIATRFRISGTVTLKIEDVPVICFTRSDDFMANGIYYKTEYEADEFRLVKLLTSRSQYFVEVGSYTGIFSIYAAKANSKLKVLCVEPHPNNYKRIQRNIILNALPNVQAVNAAAGDEEKLIAISIPKEEELSAVGSVNRGFSEGFHQAASRDVDIRQITLDQLLKDKTLGRADLVKIDVEYYELNVLNGALRLLEFAKPLLMVEIILAERLMYYKPAMKGKINEGHALEVEALLRKAGYFPYHILKDGVYRIDSVINSPDTRNFLFAPRATAERFIPLDGMKEYFKVQ